MIPQAPAPSSPYTLVLAEIEKAIANWAEQTGDEQRTERAQGAIAALFSLRGTVRNMYVLHLRTRETAPDVPA